MAAAEAEAVAAEVALAARAAALAAALRFGGANLSEVLLPYLLRLHLLWLY